MDPKLSNLDPKLREAYERVMNGPSASPQAAPPAQTQQNIPNQQAQATNQTPPVPQQPVNAASGLSATNPYAQPAATPPVSGFNPSSTIAYNAHNATKNQGTTPAKKGKSKLMPILIAFLVVILLVVYAFVWIIVFKLDVPFLPQS